MSCPAPFAIDATGECVFSVGVRVVDEFGHPLDGDHDPKGRHGCHHTDTIEWKAAHRSVRIRKLKPVKESTVDEVQADVKHEAHEQAAPSTTASVGASDDLAFDLSKVLPAGGQVSGLTVVLGGLAIAGGVALKIVPSWLRSRSEMAAKKLELKAKRMELEQKAKKDDKRDGDCASRHASCLSAISALEERVKLAEGHVDSLASDIASSKDEATKLSLKGDSGDADRLLALEKQIAALEQRVSEREE
jgi:hypothetical protein